MLLVYIAAPSSDVRKAILISEELWNDGINAYVPQLFVFTELVSPRPAEDWLHIHLDILTRCDVLLRLPGTSVEADCAIVVAKENSIPVFDNYKALYKFVREDTDGGS